MDGIHGKSCVSCSLQLMLPGTNDVPRGMESESVSLSAASDSLQPHEQ